MSFGCKGYTLLSPTVSPPNLIIPIDYRGVYAVESECLQPNLIVLISRIDIYATESDGFQLNLTIPMANIYLKVS